MASPAKSRPISDKNVMELPNTLNDLLMLKPTPETVVLMPPKANRAGV